MTYTNKLKRVFIDPDLLFHLVSSNKKVFIYNELPEGCILQRVAYDEERNKVVLLISHDSFEPVLEGAIIPEFAGEILMKDVEN